MWILVPGEHRTYALSCSQIITELLAETIQTITMRYVNGFLVMMYLVFTRAMLSMCTYTWSSLPCLQLYISLNISSIYITLAIDTKNSTKKKLIVNGQLHRNSVCNVGSKLMTNQYRSFLSCWNLKTKENASKYKNTVFKNFKKDIEYINIKCNQPWTAAMAQQTATIRVNVKAMVVSVVVGGPGKRVIVNAHITYLYGPYTHMT